MSEDKKHDIDYRVRRLGEREMPVFSRTARQIAGLAPWKRGGGGGHLALSFIGLRGK